MLLSSTHSGIRTLTLNRPEVFNSFNLDLGRAFQEALDAAASDPEVRCVVVTGAGKAFCAGQDLKEVTAPDAPDFYTVVEETYNASIRRIRAMEKPVIAAVNGVAAGAGANIALACDLVVARESAAFIQAFSKIGLIPDSGGTWILPRLVGMQRAAALAFLGDRVSASEAASLGMIYRAVADEVFEAEVDALAVRLAALPTRALGLTKRAFNAGWDQSLSDHLTTERDLQIAAAATADYAEGVAAFLEKRPAHFTGA
ncbi:MAG: enoyl-CoA hydratase-related protein [Flavobacteriales bacterium]